MKRTILAVALLLPLPVLAADHAKTSGGSPDQLWQELVDGNKRFATDKSTHPNQDAKLRASLSNGQHPGVVILSCADSRVPPEVIFDRGLGDLFVVRVAGNIPDDNILGSIEYAVEHLGSKLIVVLGHQRCGAVGAAVKGPEAEGHVASILKYLQAAVEDVKGVPGDLVDNVVRRNVYRVVGQVQTAPPILSKMIEEGRIKVIGARYDLDTGLVERVR